MGSVILRLQSRSYVPLIGALIAAFALLASGCGQNAKLSAHVLRKSGAI